MRWSVFLLALAAALPGPTFAQARRAPTAAPAPTGTPMPVRATARALGAICNENQGACIAYVTGAVDAYVGTSLVNFGRAYVCVPPQVTNQQITNVAIVFLRAHPEMQDMNAALVVVQGVSASYPCR
jgi:hypothetical protein